MLGGDEGNSVTRLLLYVAVSTLVTFYVAPFQVDNVDSYIAMLMKVSPLLMLTYFAHSHQELLTKSKNSKFHRDQHHLAFWCKLAFFFSAIGDFFMFHTHEPTWFMLGMATFSIGHVCFIHAFGFRFINKNLGIGLFIAAAVGVFVVVRDAPEPLRSAIPLYAPFLTTMLWRALDRIHHNDGRSKAMQILTPVGAAVFVISDLSIGITNFIFGSSSGYLGEYFVLATYFAAQGLIGISITT